MGNASSKIKRMSIDGMLIAVFVVLAKLTLKAGPIHFAFSGIAVVFASCYFGLGDGLIVALLGEAIIQFTSSYGLSPMTPLWILPPAFRALSLGLFALPFHKKGECLEDHLVFYALANIGGALLVTAANTGVEVLDGIVMHYSTAYLAGAILMRTLSGIASASIVAVVSLPVLRVLNHAKKKKKDPQLTEDPGKQDLDGKSEEDGSGR